MEGVRPDSEMVAVVGARCARVQLAWGVMPLDRFDCHETASVSQERSEKGDMTCKCHRGCNAFGTLAEQSL